MTKLNTPLLPSLSQPVPLVTLLLPSLSQVTSLRATTTATSAYALPSCDTSRENQSEYLKSVIERALKISAEDFSFLDDDELALAISVEDLSLLDDG
jgi:hypothetical protein